MDGEELFFQFEEGLAAGVEDCWEVRVLVVGGFRFRYLDILFRDQSPCPPLTPSLRTPINPSLSIPQRLTLIIPDRHRTAINLEHDLSRHGILDGEIIPAERHLAFPDAEGDLLVVLRKVGDHLCRTKG